MDLRQQRTWARLSAAVLQLAAEQPITEVSVSEVARAAEISRDTFYRYAASPVDLLARVLGDELEEITGFEPADLVGDRLALFGAGESALLAHFATHRALYLGAMNPGLAAPLRAMLTDRLEVVLAHYLELSPESAPLLPEGMEPETGRRMLVAYAAHGTVGAIERWLADGAPGASDAAATTIIAASPAWWWSGR